MYALIIAHGPAGYLITKKLGYQERRFTFASMAFAVLPDVDLIYYYCFDKTKTFHHLYFPHLPAALILSFLITYPIFRKRAAAMPFFQLFYINWACHLVLDTVTGGIAWLYPFKREIMKLIEIPSIHSSWVVSFMLHYSFLLEIAIVAYAGILFLRSWKKS